MEIIQTKSILAKLMATENLIIEQRKVSTASFDVKNRVLTVPVLDKNISPQLYDLFMGHEVGHALYTPLDGLMRVVELNIPRSIANVIEDHRIEKRIKNKYPGIRKPFIQGYNELIEKNFFGTSGADLNNLNFIDRFNLFSKGGPAQGIIFNETEKELVADIDSVESYDDVISVALKVTKYLKEEKAEKEENGTWMPEEDDESLEGLSDFGDDEEFDDSDQEDGDEQGSLSDENDETTDDENYGKQSSFSDPSSDGIESKTDTIFQRTQSQLFLDDNRYYYYGDIPKYDLNKVIMPYKEVWSEYKKDWIIFKQANRNWINLEKTKDIDTKQFLKVRTDAKKIVSYLAKEFEMRKNADQMKRASVAKTGELNMSKIYAYKLTDDIFKKMTVIPDGKSHGLVMFMDWSGSMFKNLNNTIKQLINLAMFCKKVNIPFEVYAFSGKDQFTTAYKPTESDIGTIATYPLKLLNLMSSKMSAAEFTYACSALLTFGDRRKDFCPDFMHLGSTPLNETVMAAMEIIPKFQKDYKLQIVNTVFLTDGDGHNCEKVWTKVTRDDKSEDIVHGYNDESLDNDGVWRKELTLVLRDPLTKNQEYVSQLRYGHSKELTAAYIKLLKARTNCNVVGFYILSGRDFNHEIRNLLPDLVDTSSLKLNFRTNKYSVITTAGYDEYYLLRAEGLDTDDDVEFVVKENASTRSLTSAFKKYAGNRLSNRVVLNRFIGLIV
jgi:hypothetical protein